ncbi:DNA-binding transcriptional LysR family regulator [Catenulispora sp. GAS73]|uniref:LysR family transcriptional regulator n=1 Tax=Catenulispora sp. GAS73 TaxID=3156269 RepID=UPI0035154074
MDLDLRLVRYFTVVAEHEGFGRAATALHVAQPALSRQIQRLEHQVGARLFDRTPQGASLTEAGQEFLPYARTLLTTAERGALAARSAPAGRLVIGHVGDLTVTPAVRELRRLHPDALIRTRHLGWRELDALPEHRVDALVTRLPLPMAPDRLRITALYDEPRMAVLPSTHRLAGKDSITLDDLADEELVACAYTPTIWGTPRPGPPGSAIPEGPGAEDGFEDKLELVAGGHSVAVLPAGEHRRASRPGLVTVPLDGIDPCRVVAATRAEDDAPLADAFHRAMAQALGVKPQ